ncbi:uncharacterized protein RAG0_11057 [Rhynchosporium agropyri]|uniref:Uncharacterized protein n=1 Tax=Rhynchosporium agropyri TaxID=914238 RepID=A0A1E1L2E0_9HELO|nr:uncharacterized protein RAG0_11057 [Rhynchosporium agropyri]
MHDHIPLNQISKELLGLNEVLELFVVSFSAHLCLMNIQFTKMLTGKGEPREQELSTAFRSPRKCMDSQSSYEQVVVASPRRLTCLCNLRKGGAIHHIPNASMARMS